MGRCVEGRVRESLLHCGGSKPAGPGLLLLFALRGRPEKSVVYSSGGAYPYQCISESEANKRTNPVVTVTQKI